MKKNLNSSGDTFSPDAAPTMSFFSGRNSLTKLFTLGGVIGSLLLSSCSDNTELTDLEADTALEQTGLFTLVPAQENLIEIPGSLTADQKNFNKTTEAPGVDDGRFNITIKYVVDVTDRQKEVFAAAAARWERIIIKDVPSITATIPSAFAGFPPVVSGTVDDIVIEVVIAPIDGPGKILGQAGPRYLRTYDRLPLSGVMYFDVDDLEFLDERDLFENVIVHEMGHVLGIGTLWNYYRQLKQGPASDPYFSGKMANNFWKAEGGTNFLPIENKGGPGTAGGHWRESLLRNELMTGYINYGVNPLSRITAGSLADMGYGTAIVGEAYELQRGTPGVSIDELAKSGDHGLYIAERETILEPIGIIVTE